VGHSPDTPQAVPSPRERYVITDLLSPLSFAEGAVSLGSHLSIGPEQSRRMYQYRPKKKIPVLSPTQKTTATDASMPVNMPSYNHSTITLSFCTTLKN
jgi:hypothetical protein